MMNKKEIVITLFKGVLLIILLGYFFYRSVYMTLIMMPGVYIYLLYKGREAEEKRKHLMMLQFKELLGSVKSSLQVGYSLENAFIEAGKDMLQMYGKDAGIVKELKYIKAGLDNNRSITELLNEFASREGIKEAEDFAGILNVGKKAGGNLGRIMDSYIRMIEEKVALMLEIDTMVAARRFEQKIMNTIPFFIIFYVELTNNGFFGILYHNIFGFAVMTVTLIIYLCSVCLSDKMIRISI